jgi:hypothetical protein
VEPDQPPEAEASPLDGATQDAVDKIDRLTTLSRRFAFVLTVYVAVILTVAITLSAITMFRIGRLAEENSARLARERAATREGERVIEEFRMLLQEQLELSEENREILLRLEGLLDGLDQRTP